MFKNMIKSILRKIWYKLRPTMIKVCTQINNAAIERTVVPELYDWHGAKIDIYHVIATMEDPINKMKKFSDLPIIKELQSCSTIQILQERFYDIEGKTYLSGGAERYLCDLAKIIISLGYRPFIVQNGTHFWHLKHNNIDVFGVPTACAMPMLNILAHDKIFGSPKMRIYSGFVLAYPNVADASIGIGHGMFWSNANTPKMWLSTIQKAYKGLSNFVSVDKATLSWFYGFMPSETASKSTSYLPNYVDLEQFKPQPKENDGIIRIIYPRRIYEICGYFLVEKVVPTILDRYHNVEFHFVGQADSPAKESVEELVSKYKGKVFTYFQPADKMREIYNKADITIIPTILNEGTSLSCLEAMASGNAIIATTVGGLSDLIIHNFNGILIDPSYWNLFRALEKLISLPEIRSKLGKNAVEVAQCYNKIEWDNKWKVLINDVLNQSYSLKGKIYEE